MIRIYLAGGMEGLTWEEQTEWRRRVKNELELCSCGKERVVITDPTDYYNFQNPTHISPREPMEYDLWQVEHSNLVIVNYTYKPVSLGTMAEITTAYNFHIPVIGLAEQGASKLHDWQQCIPIRIFENMDELIRYVNDYYVR